MESGLEILYTHHKVWTDSRPNLPNYTPIFISL